MKPLAGRIIVRPIAPASRIGSIIVPDIMRGATNYAEVVHVGKCTSIARGDRVIFAIGAGRVIDHGTEKLLVMKEDDILAIVEIDAVRPLDEFDRAIEEAVRESVEANEGGTDA